MEQHDYSNDAVDLGVEVASAIVSANHSVVRALATMILRQEKSAKAITEALNGVAQAIRDANAAPNTPKRNQRVRRSGRSLEQKSLFRE